MLCRCCDWVGRCSYEELAIAAFGRAGSIAMEVLVIWLLLGAMTSLLVIARDSLVLALGDLNPFGSSWQGRAMLTVLDVILVILPLSQLQSPASLLYSNLVAVLCMLLVSIMLAMRAAACSECRLWHGADWIVDYSAPATSSLRAVPIVMLSLGCQVQVPCIYADLERRSVPRMSVAIAAAMGLCVALYGVVGISGLLLAVHGGAVKVPGNILDVFAPDDSLALAMRGIISIAVTLVYPMLCLPCRSTLDHLLFGSAEKRPQGGCRPKLETIVIIGLTLVFSTLATDLSRVFGFTGATSGALICYVLPLAVFLKLRKDQPADVQAATQVSAYLSVAALACLIPLVALTTEAQMF
ncbi:unnamed protein product [Polarella glacialis]|uniref:Amino acid transporter transmembrane domain-containing protein n=2 Tax=Polarella glacialis TaxID=89957 RepID=A0A813IEQ9_POLGL|nr:unnamed protein product [Polarella glacialis]